MTTPSQSILDEGRSEIVGYSQRKNSTVVNTVRSTVTSSSTVKLRPQSSTSPYRSNGTRAPRAWNHEWSSSTIVPSYHEAEQEPANGWRTWGLLTMNASPVRFMADTAISWNRNKRFPIAVDQAARTAFLSKLSGRRADLGAALGELRQTARGVTDASRDVVRGIDNLANTYRRSKRAIVNEILRFGRGGKPKANPNSPGWSTHSLERLRDEWLRYQFGVKPLIGSIDDAGNALSDAIFEKQQELRLSIKAGASDESEYTYKGVTAGSLNATCEITFTEKTQCHYSGVYRIPVTGDRTLQELGLGNPADVAWELTQLSWMVDYVLGVGDWLGSLTADWGTQFVEGSVSRIQRADVVNGEMKVRAPSGYSFTRQPRIMVTHVSGRFERTLLDSRILPAVMPVVRNQLGLSQMANSLSVLSQIMGRNHRT